MDSAADQDHSLHCVLHRLDTMQVELDRLRATVQSLVDGASAAPLDAPDAPDMLAPSTQPPAPPPPEPPPGRASTHGSPVALTDGVNQYSAPAEKVALFRRRFVGREDAYAHRWISRKTGKAGWGPVVRGGYFTRDTTNADLLPLTDQVISEHLRTTRTSAHGELHAGLYPMLPGDRCALLACDFDGGDWHEDATAFVEACREAGADVLLERSRSGNGAHVWMFFDRSLPAERARRFGMILLHRAMNHRPQMSLTSYDRFFPAQDTLPDKSAGSARLGNLIALPLEGDCRERGMTVFLDPATLEPLPDQFAALAACAPVAVEHVEQFLASEPVPGTGPTDQWARRPTRAQIRKSARAVKGIALELRCDAMVHVPVTALPGVVVTALKHCASIPNPQFYKRQQQRFSTYGIPRLITCFEHDDAELRLPRGLLDDASRILEDAGCQVTCTHTDACIYPEIDVHFRATLRPEQQHAVDAMLAHRTGVLDAPTGSGKTVMACALIAERRVPTAVVVNTKDLLVQWRQRLVEFLNVTDSQIGQLGAGRRKRKGTVDVIMLQSVAHRDADPSVLEEYGQVIVDECHCVAAPSAEAALRTVNVPRWVGLSATPYRADRMDGLITMQCGPIRHRMEPGEQSARRLVIHETGFTTEETGADGPSIQAIYSEIAADPVRNAGIVADVMADAIAGRSCLVLTNRLDHLQRLADGIERAFRSPQGASGDGTGDVPADGPGSGTDKVSGQAGEPGTGAIPVLRLHGHLTPPERRQVNEELRAADGSGHPYVLVAMDKVAGEGLDLQQLSSEFLAVPVSFKGRVKQHIGRIVRSKGVEALVHDYVDVEVSVLERMARRRRRTMGKEGFRAAPPLSADRHRLGDDLNRAVSAPAPTSLAGPEGTSRST